MSKHPYNMHREQQVAHRRVGHILKDAPSGADSAMAGPAFSKITSKTAAESDDGIAGRSGANRFARGGKVKGGNTTNIIIAGGKETPPAPPMPMPMMPPPGPPPGGPPPGGPPPMGGPGGPPPGPGGPPPMPMRASGGRVGKNGGGPTHIAGDTLATKNGRAMNKFGERADKPIVSIPNGPKMGDYVAGVRASGGRVSGQATKPALDAWSKVASKNSYAKGGGVKMTAGAESGVGRLQKAKSSKRGR